MTCRVAEDRGDRAALDPLRRGRPHPAPLYPAPRAGERDRQGRAARRKSRFGGRLEPFFRLDLVLHEGRADLLTVTARRDASPATRACASTAAALDVAARACDAVARAVRRRRPAPRRLPPARQRARAARRATRRARGRANALAFRLKLLLAAGFAPQLAACASCGEREHLVGFSGAAGGVVCARLRGGLVPARRGGARLPRRGARPPAGRGARPRAPRALAQAERAIRETLEHHAHVRLRAVRVRG